MIANYVEIPGSHREPPKGLPAIASAHASMSAEPIEISVYLKDRSADDLLNQGPISASVAAERNASAPDVASQRAAEYADDFAKIADFANETGLAVVKQDPARRLVKLSGPIDKIEAAYLSGST